LSWIKSRTFSRLARSRWTRAVKKRKGEEEKKRKTPTIEKEQKGSAEVLG